MRDPWKMIIPFLDEETHKILLKNRFLRYKSSHQRFENLKFREIVELSELLMGTIWDTLKSIISATKSDKFTQKEIKFFYPSKNAEKILYMILPSNKRDAIIGDLLESYHEILLKFGVKYARKWFWFQTIRNIMPLLRLRWIIVLGLLKGVFSRILDGIK